MSELSQTFKHNTRLQFTGTIHKICENFKEKPAYYMGGDTKPIAIKVPIIRHNAAQQWHHQTNQDCGAHLIIKVAGFYLLLNTIFHV